MVNNKFKFQAQDSFLEYIFLKIWILKKRIALSEKKPTLSMRAVCEHTPNQMFFAGSGNKDLWYVWALL